MTTDPEGGKPVRSRRSVNFPLWLAGVGIILGALVLVAAWQGWMPAARPAARQAEVSQPTSSINTGAESTAETFGAVRSELALDAQVDSLQVLQVFPAQGARDVESSSVITVIFNQPMVSLQIHEERGGQPDPLVITPELGGEGEWLSTSVYIFHPEGYLQGSTTYSVRVPAGLSNAAGTQSLADDYTWSFTTISPGFAEYWMVGREWEINPADHARDILLDQAIAISFYQPMDEASVNDNLSILNQAGGEVALEYGWDENATQVTITPTQRLAYGMNYTLSLNQEAQAFDGGQLRDGLTWHFRTILTPAITRTTPTDGRTQATFSGEFFIQFAGPMDFDSLDERVVFDPPLEGDRLEWYYDEWGWGAHYFGLSPSTAYEVTILPGMADKYGRQITTTTTVRFTTAAYDPAAYLMMPYGNPLFRTGGSQDFYVEYRNIQSVEARLYRLTMDDWITLQNGTTDLYRYTPRQSELVWSDSHESGAGLNEISQAVFIPRVGNRELPGGLYFLGIISPEVNRYGAPFNDSRLVMVVDANLTFKTTQTEALAWLTDMASGEPLSGVRLDYYGSQSRPVRSGVTDDDGLLYLEDLPYDSENAYLPRYIATAEGSEIFAIASSNMQNDVSLYNYGVWSDYYALPEQMTAYVYTERPIYRPGQPVYFRGIVRLDDDLTYHLPDLSEIQVTINSFEETIYTATLPLSEFGTFDGEITLDSQAAVGQYSLNVLAPGGGQNGQTPPIGSVSFSVAEYRRPEFQVQVSTPDPDLLPGETGVFTVSAAYYSGGGVSGGQVAWQLYAQAYTFPAPLEYQSYSFSDFDLDTGYFYEGIYPPGNELIAEGTGQTDARGVFTASLPLELIESRTGKQLMFEASLWDVAGAVVSGRDWVTLHKSQIYPGVRPEAYVGTSGEEQTFQLVALDWHGAPVAGQVMNVEIVERHWYSVQEEDAQGVLVWRTTVEDIPIETFRGIVADEEGSAQVTFTPPNGGVYRALVTAVDDEGNEGSGAAYMWIAGEEYIPWRQNNDRGFELILDQSEYSPGDTAEVLIASPFQGEATALLTVERGHIRSYEVIHLTSNSTIYNLPITADMAPSVYVFVTIIKGVDETIAMPDFRIGLAEVKVNTRLQTLTVELSTAQEQAGPGETVTYSVQTLDAAGEPVSAEVSLGLSDLATLSLSAPNSQPIVDYFYSRRSLKVWTSIPMIYNIEYYNRDIAGAGAVPQAMGSGGGKGGESVGVIEVRQDFPDTAYWEAHLVTPESGAISVSVTLPDNLTTWRMDARAVTMDTHVGETTLDLVSTKPLLVRPQTPRFFVAGDHAVVGTAVHNNTAVNLSVEVNLRGRGVRLDGPPRQVVEIAAGQQAYVTWGVTVLASAQRVDLVFEAESGEYSDASTSTVGALEGGGLPVYRYEVPETVGTSGQMMDGGTIVETVSLPEAYATSQGELIIRLAPSLAAGMTDGLTYLENYPYSCVEQTISSFLPNVLTTQAMKLAGLSDPELEANLAEEVNIALQRLYNWQNPGGGWGWCAGVRSDVLTTAYATLGLIEAQRAGYTVSQNVLERALDFVAGHILVISDNSQPEVLNKQAFGLYVLARAGTPNVSKTMQLYEQRQRLATYAKAYLLETIFIIEPGSPRLESLLSDLNNSAIVSATGTHWEEAAPDYLDWNTDTRTTAIVLSAISLVDPENPLNGNATRWLMSNRSDGHWASTQETAWTIMALTNWMAASGELEADYSFQVMLNGTLLQEGQANADTLRETYEQRVDIADLQRANPNRLEIERSAGAGNLYYSEHLRVYLPVSEITALSQGLIVSRAYYRLDDLTTPVSSTTQGEQLLARITLVALHDLHYVVVDDPLPAGLEAVDQSLLTSPQGMQVQNYTWDDLLYRGLGWWYFDHVEMRDERVVLTAQELPAGTYMYTYLVRASTAGTYQVIPTSAWELYFPEVYGRGDGSLFEVLP